jgi:hypothetical protein
MKRAGTSRTNKGRFGSLVGFLGENGKIRPAGVNEPYVGGFFPEVRQKKGQ